MPALPGIMLEAGVAKANKAWEELPVLRHQYGGRTAEGVGMGGTIKRTASSPVQPAGIPAHIPHSKHFFLTVP